MSGGGSSIALATGLSAYPLRVAKIRTSDRSAFKRCRRKWDWSYSARHNRDANESRAPFWTGTGFHFALEDFHAHKVYPTAADAFQAYSDAWAALMKSRDAPDIRMLERADWDEQLHLAKSMLSYYQDNWLEMGRDELETFYWKGKPQVEVRFEIEIPLDPGYVAACGYDKVVYQGTIDRVMVDEYGRLWVVEYKTAKRFETGHFDTDSQITAYCWACEIIYDMPFAGIVYQQHKKVVTQEPKWLETRNMYSVAQSQATTYSLYRKALEKTYGKVINAPTANIQYLNNLAHLETNFRDDFVRRDYITRNRHQIWSVERDIMLEAADMINPKLPIYKNPTRDCSWDCSFQMMCVMKDDGSDWVSEMEMSTIDREEVGDKWRKYLPKPQRLLTSPEQSPEDLEMAELLGELPPDPSHLLRAEPQVLLVPREQVLLTGPQILQREVVRRS